MAEQRQAPTVPPFPWFDPKTGSPTPAFYKFIIGERGRITNVNSGVNELAEAQVQTAAGLQTQISAVAAATQASMSGSTTQDFDEFSEETVDSDTYATFATCNITTTGAGNYTITAVLTVNGTSDIPAVSSGTSFSGRYRVIENAGATVLVSEGTFTVTSSPFNEAGITYYLNEIAFSPALPSGTTAASSVVGAATVEFQLRRGSGSNDCRFLAGSLLTTWA